MKKIECVIMDWAGTAVDYGCFAPVAAFLKAFGEVGITVTMEEARRPMGMAKIDHIRELFKLPGVTEQFQKLYNRLWTEEDVVAMNREFEKYLFASLQEYTTPIPGVIETIGELKKAGIKIGSTTGYTRAMMDVVLPGAAAKGYTTDNCVTPRRSSCRTSSAFYDLQKHDRFECTFRNKCCEIWGYHCRHQRRSECRRMDCRCHSGQQRNGAYPRRNRETSIR